MKQWAAVALLLLCTARAGVNDATPQALAAIRKNYAAVNQLSLSGKLLRQKRDYDCLNAVDSLRMIWRDGSGRARKYLFQGGSEDSLVTVSQFYEADGRLSFALIELGAVNGTLAQTRLYYGRAGNIIREEDRLVRGPGYPGLPFWQWVVQFPEVAFNAPPPCKAP